MSTVIRDNLLRHLVNLSPFFEQPRRFLEDLVKNDFAYLNYDSSVQLAIRLTRWSKAIDFTPLQTHVMNRILEEAIHRSAKLVKYRLLSCDWFIPSVDGEIAMAVASKAILHLVETHDFCGGKKGAVIPNPSIVAFVTKHTRFISRESMEYFAYHKPLKAEGPAQSTAPSSFLLETYIRQQKSLLKNKTSPEEKADAENTIRELSARLYGLRSEIRLSQVDDDDDQENVAHISSEDQLQMASWDPSIPDQHHAFSEQEEEFLDYLFRIGEKQMSARDLIPALIKARDFRAIHGLLRVLKDPCLEDEAQILSDMLGHRPLSDIRKQILRIRKSDNIQVLQLLSACKSFMEDEVPEEEVVHLAMACGG